MDKNRLRVTLHKAGPHRFNYSPVAVNTNTETCQRLTQIKTKQSNNQGNKKEKKKSRLALKQLVKLIVLTHLFK